MQATENGGGLGNGRKLYSLASQKLRQNGIHHSTTAACFTHVPAHRYTHDQKPRVPVNVRMPKNLVVADTHAYVCGSMCTCALYTDTQLPVSRK